MPRKIWLPVLLLLAFIFSFAVVVIFAKKNFRALRSDETASEKPIETHENVKVIKLTAIDGKTGDGLASRSFSGNVFSISISANLADTGQEKFYEAWLLDENSGNHFSLGKLEKRDSNFLLSFSDAKDYPDHKTLLISLEAAEKGLDSQIGDKILEGSL